MEYTDVKNPVWANEEHTLINCRVLFVGQSTFFPFTASATDTVSYSVDIFNQCAAGQWGAVGAYNPAPTPVPTADDNKSTAVQLLSDTDWTMTDDVANPAISNPYLSNQTEFGVYRNTVRQIAINPVPGVLTWPEAPTAVWTPSP